MLIKSQEIYKLIYETFPSDYRMMQLSKKEQIIFVSFLENTFSLKVIESLCNVTNEYCLTEYKDEIIYYPYIKKSIKELFSYINLYASSLQKTTILKENNKTKFIGHQIVGENIFSNQYQSTLKMLWLGFVNEFLIKLYNSLEELNNETILFFDFFSSFCINFLKEAFHPKILMEDYNIDITKQFETTQHYIFNECFIAKGNQMNENLVIDSLDLFKIKRYSN